MHSQPGGPLPPEELPAATALSSPLLFIEEFEVVIMIEVVTEEMGRTEILT
jgi:hypothetical protein